MASDANKNNLIKIENVCYDYGYRNVIENISFQINSGDFLAVLGPNGSGKTTLIKIILGLLKPKKGQIRMWGKPVQDFKNWQKIGYVPQKATHFDPFFPASVKEVVAMGCLSRRKFFSYDKLKESQSIDRALEHVGMKDFKSDRIGRLSGGQQQRVFIARAIVNMPEILFLDEPTTGVDTEMHDQFYDMLGTLNQRENMTIVLVTHEVGIINKHVKQVACLNKSLVYHGTHTEFCKSDEFRKMLEGGHHLVSHRH
ncbi:MAG: ATP-binding cassette domain-containing protein [Candidatus Aminicenantes bacterium]|nr:ATP-binding cassette domain-containing protein [Candidatus Aminicenantes bacterium]